MQHDMRAAGMQHDMRAQHAWRSAQGTLAVCGRARIAWQGAHCGRACPRFVARRALLDLLTSICSCSGVSSRGAKPPRRCSCQSTKRGSRSSVCTVCCGLSCWQYFSTGSAKRSSWPVCT